MITNLINRIKFGIKYHYYQMNFILFDIQQQIFNYSANPIIIYQMGKIGSSSVFYSLKKVKRSHPIFHCHYISHEHIQQIDEYYKSINKSNSNTIYVTKKMGNFLRNKINSGRYHWKIISLVRDPVSLEVSDFFQNIIRDLNQADLSPNPVIVNKYQKYIKKRFENYNEKTNFYCNWFNHELKQTFNFDIFNHEFDKKNGYKIYHIKNADILVIKLEYLSKVFQIAIGEFLDIDNINLKNANIGEKKDYKKIYEIVKSSLKISDNTLMKIYSSEYVHHFYTQDEISEFISKWVV